MSIEAIKQEIIDEFMLFDDWMDRYDYLIEQGKNLKPLSPEHKKEENLIKGCQSKVWLHAFLNEKGNIIFKAESDAVITKGMIALLIRVFSDQRTVEVEKADIDFLNEIGLKEQLSPTRSNGLHSMVKQMKYYAFALGSKTKSDSK